jgi:hypothetical protein
MLNNPRPGQRVEIHYGPNYAGVCAKFQDRRGTVAVPGTGRPRNHAVLIDGRPEPVVIPAGNLNKVDR